MPPIRKKTNEAQHSSDSQNSFTFKVGNINKSKVKLQRRSKSRNKVANQNGACDEGSDYQQVLISTCNEYARLCQDKFVKLDSSMKDNIEGAQHKLTEFLKNQNLGRDKLLEELAKNVNLMTHQKDKDLVAARDNLSKVENLLKQCIKTTLDTQLVYECRLQGIKDLFTEFNEQWKVIQDSNKLKERALAQAITEDMKTLQANLIKHSKKESMDSFRNALFSTLPADI